MGVILALVAALMHASWNVLLKAKGDPLDTFTRAVTVSAGVLWLPAAAIWLWAGRPGITLLGAAVLAVSVMLELAYFVLLSRAYRVGELSAVYPLARGTAPVIAVVLGVSVLHERLRPLEAVGVVALLVGIWLVRPPGAGLGRTAAWPALGAGIFIGLYSVLDRVGVRLMGPGLYAWWLWSGMAVALVVFTRARPLRSVPVKDALGSADESLPGWGRAAVIGILMFGAYGLVLVALTLAPVTVISPVRESAVVLVAAWGVLRMGEKAGARKRLAGALVIVIGALLVATA